MNRRQKAALAALVISRVAGLTEFWTDLTADEPDLADVDLEEVRTVLGAWMNRLPGDFWDTRLPMPTDHKDTK